MRKLFCWLGLHGRGFWGWVVDNEGERPLERDVRFCGCCGQVLELHGERPAQVRP